MRWSDLLFILFPSDTRVSEIYFEKNLKLMMSFCMTKLEFLLEPYMMFRLGNFHSYMLLAFALSLVKLC
jgi:hypothetical protein